MAAIDGAHFGMQAPSNSDVDNPLKYHVARKDEYALLMIAMCDQVCVLSSVSNVCVCSLRVCVTLVHTSACTHQNMC